ERQRGDEGQRAQKLPLLLGEAAFRTDEHRQTALGDAAQHRQRLRGATGFALVAEDDAAAGLDARPAVEKLAQRQRLVDLRQAEDAALLRRLDGVGFHALQVEAADLRVLGQDRAEQAGA